MQIYHKHKQLKTLRYTIYTRIHTYLHTHIYIYISALAYVIVYAQTYFMHPRIYQNNVIFLILPANERYPLI